MHNYVKFGQNTSKFSQDTERKQMASQTDNLKTVSPPHTSYAGGIIKVIQSEKLLPDR